MPATFKLILAPAPDREGLHDVRLRITANRVVRYLNVPGVALQPKHWNEARSLKKPNYLRTSHHEHAELEDTLLTFLGRAQKLGRDRPHSTADELKQVLSTGADLAEPAPVVSEDFLAFAFKSLEQVDKPSFTAGTTELRATCLNKFADWWQWEGGKKPLPMSELSEQLLTDYERHLQLVLKNGPTTRRKNLDTLQLYFKRAIKKGLLPRHANPLEYYERPSRNTPSRVWLTESELTALETVALPPQQHVARATYFIQYYLHGSRIGVVLKMQWKQRSLGVVRFRMDKGDREKVVEESPQLTALLDSFLPADGSEPDPEAFILPWLPARYLQMSESKALQEMKKATAVVNMNLKRAGVRAGITAHFSSHSSRRTLADNADNLTEDLGVVQGLLGHSARATTEKYTRGRDTPAVHRGAKKVYSQRPMPLVKPE
jgi:integrase